MELQHIKIGELVAEDYRTAEVFKSYGLDFCCGGGKSIEQACKDKSINLHELLKDLAAVGQSPKNGMHDFNSWGLDFLIDYIINTHHQYVSNNIPLINEFAAKVAAVHGVASPEVIKIQQLFAELSEELLQHMQKEEVMLFPYVKELVNQQKQGEGVIPVPFGSVTNPIAVMEHEHDSAGVTIKKIAMLSNDFTPPEHACNTFTVLYAKLKEFQDNLFEHVHLENNILFPKAVALEAKMLTSRPSSE